MTEGSKNIPHLDELREKLKTARKQVREKKYQDALASLQEILALEKNHADVETLVSEAKALAIKATKNRKVHKFRLIMIGIFTVTTVLVALFANMKVFSTQVELQVAVSEFSFKIAQRWDVFSLAARTIGISHLDSLTLEVVSVETATGYDPQTDKPVSWRLLETEDQLLIKPQHPNWGIELQSPYLNLTNLYAEPGASITVSRDDNLRNQIGIRISEGNVSGSIDVGDTLLFSCSSCDIGNGLFGNGASTKSLRLTTFDNQVNFRELNGIIELVLEFPIEKDSSEPMLLGKGIAIQSIDFSRFVGDVKEPTLIADGKLYFSELDNEELTIREGDFVLLDKLKNFRIRKLELTDRLLLTVMGKAGKIETGSEDFLYSRLPSLLDWLQTNQFITLMLATIIPIFTTIVILFNRMRITEDL